MTVSLQNQHAMLDRLITIATFSHPEEAYIWRAKLDSEGIWSSVADANIVTMNWLYCNAVGGVKLQVRESDAPEANEVLHSKTVYEMVPAEDAQYSERCPNCGSPDIHYEVFSMHAVSVSWLIIGLLMGDGALPLPFLKRKLKCRACGHEWKAKTSGQVDRRSGNQENQE